MLRKRAVASYSAILLLLVAFPSLSFPVIAEPSSPDMVTTVGEAIDWPQFWTLFRQYALWDLEWYDGSSWVSVKGDMDVQLSYPEPNRCKVNLVFDASHAGNYRLTHAINKEVREHISRVDKYQYDLTYDDMQITFDWSDCAEIPGLQFSHGVKNGYFWFRIRRDNVPLGAHVEIDPATVATSTTIQAVQYGYMRKSFHAEGLFWAFYSDGTNAVWEWSADGADWTNGSTSIGACRYGNYFSVWYDGTYIHYTRTDYFGTSDTYYRRGTPVNDGSINWSAAEQLVFDGAGNNYYKFPCITVDTNGFAWIGANYDENTGDDFPVAMKNANNDGTWALDFITELSAIDDTGWKVAVIPLTDGKVYAIYCDASRAPLGKLYDAGWGGEENDLADYNIEDGFEFSAVAYGDNVHFIYNRDATYQIRHNERVWGVGWNASDVLIYSPAQSDMSPALSLDNYMNELYCFWTYNTPDHVFYKKYSGGVWDVAATDWIDESTDDIEKDYLISSYYQDYDGYIGLLYTTKTGSPYNVRFEFLQVYIPPLIITITSNPTGSGFVDVDGAGITTPRNYLWTTNDNHTLTANSPVIIIADQERYVFLSWSDGGAQNHTYTVPGAGETVTANFTHQYYLLLTSSPATGPTVTGGGWYTSGNIATLTATTPYIDGDTVLEFQKWTWKLGAVTQDALVDNPVNITMTNYVSAVGVYPIGAGGPWLLPMLLGFMGLVVIMAARRKR